MISADFTIDVKYLAIKCMLQYIATERRNRYPNAAVTPETTVDLLPLLCPVARLLDLHDADRALGGSPAFGKEDRTGNQKGIYLDIATIVLECLRKLDERSSQDYLPFHIIYEFVNGVRVTDENDVLYVLNVLRRPTELWYVDRTGVEVSLRSESRKTALVEKTDYADEYRLSPTGRTLPSLASAAHDASYLRGDAYNLLQAIEWNDFDRIITFAAEISTRLRVEILSIRSTLEKVGTQERIPQYVDRFSQYQKMIDETVAILQQAERELGGPDALEAFHGWLDRENVNDLSFEGMQQSVLNVRRTLTIFNRLVSELVTAVLQNKRSAVRPVSFLAFASHLVKAPAAIDTLDFLLRQWGALELVVPDYTYADFAGAIRVRSAMAAEPQIFDGESSEEVSQLGRLKFMNAYGEELAERLREGPVRLSEALDLGYFEIDNGLVLGDLVGAFVAPDSLPVAGPVTVRLASELGEKDLGAGRTLLFSDIEISLHEELKE